MKKKNRLPHGVKGLEKRGKKALSLSCYYYYYNLRPEQ